MQEIHYTCIIDFKLYPRRAVGVYCVLANRTPARTHMKDSAVQIPSSVSWVLLIVHELIKREQIKNDVSHYKDLILSDRSTEDYLV